MKKLAIGPGGLSDRTKAAITVATMTACAAIGFYVQSKLISRFYEGEAAELNARVREIKRLELAALREAAGAEDEATARAAREGSSVIGGRR